MKFWFNSLGAVGFSLVKKCNLEKEGKAEMGEIFFYLQETSLYEKLYFFFSLVPVPNCSRTNARNSLIYLYCFAVWVLLYLAFAVTYDCAANNTRNIYLVEESWREGIQKGPLSTCCQKPAGITPGPPALPARVQSPVDFRALQLQQCGRVWGGINAFSGERKQQHCEFLSVVPSEFI